MVTPDAGQPFVTEPHQAWGSNGLQGQGHWPVKQPEASPDDLQSIWCVWAGFELVADVDS
jgi:hypothetical protein